MKPARIAPLATALSIQASPRRMGVVEEVCWAKFDGIMEAFLSGAMPGFPANGLIREYFYLAGSIPEVWYRRYGRYRHAYNPTDPAEDPVIEINFTSGDWHISLEYPALSPPGAFVQAEYYGTHSPPGTDVRGTYTLTFCSDPGYQPPGTCTLDSIKTQLEA
jgi:hypothetical protein